MKKQSNLLGRRLVYVSDMITVRDIKPVRVGVGQGTEV